MELFDRLGARVKRACTAAKGALDRVREDVAAVRERDPAATSDLEVLLLYPGVHALLCHRAAHVLHEGGHRFAARAVSQGARLLTGIEIHPGAKVGRRLVIDHGAAIVIGETAEIGDDCTIYQGVTLGGTGKDTGKRHPTIGNHVLIGAGAKVLGPFTVGDHARIAAGAVVLEAVPPDATAVGIPAHVVRLGREKIKGEELDQIHVPDPIEQQLCRLARRVLELEKQLGISEGVGSDPESGSEHANAPRENGAEG